MTTVGVGEAKTHLSRLLREVEQGGEVLIERDGRPVAKLVAVPPPPAPHWFGMDAGLFEVPEEFNEPLPELEQYFA